MLRWAYRIPRCRRRWATARKAACPTQWGLSKQVCEPHVYRAAPGVRLKLSADAPVVKNKRIVPLDDFIVLRTACNRFVVLLKEAGAEAIHLRIASSPMVYPCFYGVDTSYREALISQRLGVKAPCAFTGAASLHFLRRRICGMPCLLYR